MTDDHITRMPETEGPTAREPDTTGPEPLRFENDRGARRSTWIAGALTLGIVAWMGSGFVLPAGDAAEAPQE